MRRFILQLCLALIFLAFPNAALSQKGEAVEKTQKIIGEIIEKSYPELKTAKTEVKTFQSQSNFFKSQFSINRYLTFQKLHYIVFVNPEIYRRNAPENAIRAILAHELAHILYYKRKNRIELLGLTSLTNKSFTVKFERKADLEAISRGYGEGLKAYREWLYKNIPAKNLKAKRRDYFSPEEIDLMLKILQEKPEMIDVWRKDAPRSLKEISNQPGG